jgi:hypothetical protein
MEEYAIDTLKVDLDTLLEIAKKAESVRRLLGEDGLYSERLTALVRGTKKEDPKECKYVAKALAEALYKESFLKLKILVDDIVRLYER